MERQSVGVLTALLLLAGCGGQEENSERQSNITFEDSTVFVPKAAEQDANLSDANLSNVVQPVGLAVTLAPDGLGISLPDAAMRHITFRTARAATIEALGAVLGAPIEQGDNQECGAGPLAFANFRGGLSLYFQGDRFAGWDLDGSDTANFSTANGISIGSTRKLVEAAGKTSVEDSSIGIEFMTGGLSGLLDGRAPDSRVTNLWAGVTCLAR